MSTASDPRRTLEADVVVVGSGPGGATMARELSQYGKKIILCEAGRWNKVLGLTLSTTNMMDRKGFTFSKEGTWVVRPKTVGGATVVFCGTAWKPPLWLKEKYGVDLDQELKEIYREVPIRPLPDHLIGPAATRILTAARDIGLDWNPLDKWIRSDKCRTNCGKCFLGCAQKDAKWTAREFVQEAAARGATVLTRTHVDRVLVQGDKAVGVSARDPHGWLEISAEKVVLSAGGQGTPPILQRAGLHEAGSGFFADPLWLVVGPASLQGSKYDVPMTAGTHLEKESIVLTDVLCPPLFFAGMFALKGLGGLVSLPKALLSYRRTFGIMVKVRDDLAGRVNLDESFSKPLDEATWFKLNKGAVVAEEILRKAGVKRQEITRSVVIGAHPGGTVRIGGLLDQNCQTPIRNLYCMDASILPEPWGLPPSLTIVAMARRLAKHLVGRLAVCPQSHTQC